MWNLIHNRQVSRVDQPLPSLTLGSRGVRSHIHSQALFARGFYATTIAAQCATLGLHFRINGRVPVGPHHHLTTVAVGCGIRRNLGIGLHHCLLGVSKGFILPFPATAHMHCTAACGAIRRNAGTTQHRHAFAGDINFATLALGTFGKNLPACQYITLRNKPNNTALAQPCACGLNHTTVFHQMRKQGCIFADNLTQVHCFVAVLGGNGQANGGMPHVDNGNAVTCGQQNLTIGVNDAAVFNAGGQQNNGATRVRSQ